ncbi:MAG: hypothetical protein CMC75_02885 [Flavobacteriaceae bacterium]|nr:hypothetical protein [Flavobacteriaceae bacterium]
MKNPIMKNNILLALLICVSYTAFSQVGIGNIDPKATLDISATNIAPPANTDGLLIPRIDEFPATNPTADQDGMMVFITGDGVPAKGFYYWDQDAGPAAWVSVISAVDADWFEAGTTAAPEDNTDDIFTLGYVGIGESNPDNPLYIGTITSFDLSHANTGQDGVFIVGGGDNSGVNAVGGSISFGPPAGTRSTDRKSAISSVQTGTDTDHTGLAFYVHGNAINQSPMVEGMRLTHQRYLGINNNDPSATLDVVGSLQYEDGNEAAGYVLTSDAAGNATWEAPSMASIFSNPKFPDGFSGITPITHFFSTGSYTVPTGKNLYITSYRSLDSGGVIFVDGNRVASGRQNAGNTNNIINPMLAGSGQVITASVSTEIINGFTVDANVTPITSGANPSYTVPPNKILIVLSFINASTTGSSLFALNGTNIYSGNGNSDNTVGQNSFSGPFIFDEADVITSTNGNFNGYLIDK